MLRLKKRHSSETGHRAGGGASCRSQAAGISSRLFNVNAFGWSSLPVAGRTADFECAVLGLSPVGFPFRYSGLSSATVQAPFSDVGGTRFMEVCD